MDNNMNFCQSCAMPLNSLEVQGTNADGSKNEEYCHYCFKDGEFCKNETMEEMIESCIPFVSKGDPWPDEDSARRGMQELFPQLKRWKKA